MRKKLLSVVFSIAFYSAYAQVGIGTTAPKATLDVVGNPDDVNSLDGILAPRMTGDQLADKEYTSDQDGAMVYVTSPATSLNGQTADVTAIGLYVFGSTQNKWLSVDQSISKWSLSGNEITASDFLGTLNAMNLPIRTNNVERFSFTTNGQLTFLKNGSAGAIMIGEGSDGDAGDIAIGNNTLSRGSGDNIAIGSSATANKPNTIALGKEASAIEQSAMAIGQNSEASGVRSLSFGMGANASGIEAISLGVGTVASGGHGIAIGARSNAKDYENTLAIGTRAAASGGEGATAIGSNSVASNSQASAFGDQATASAPNSVALGSSAQARGNSSVVLGLNAVAHNESSMSLGVGAVSQGNNAISIGINSSTTSQNSMAFGNNATASNDSSIAIGQNSQATAVRSVALGNGVRAFGKNSVAIGYGAKADKDNTIILGNGSRVGIATFAPDNTTKLHVKGAVRIEDGTQGAGKVLTSDANGRASWQDNGVPNGVQFYSYDIANTASPDIKDLETNTVVSKSGVYNGPLSLSSTDMSPASDNEGFVIKIVGTYTVENTGDFTFSQRSDDGARIYIDGSLVLSDWKDGAANTTSSNPISLAKGKHKFEFWFYEDSGDQEFSFSWGTNPDGNSGIMEANQFTIE